MALYDKHHAIRFGIPTGIKAHEEGGEELLYFMDVPFEFRDHLVPEWVSARGWMLFDSPTCVMRTRLDGDGLAYTWQSWETFVDWMTATLDAAAIAIQRRDGITATEAQARLDAPCLADLRAGRFAATQLPLVVANARRAFKGGLSNGVPIINGTFGSGRYQRDIPLEWCSPLLEWLTAQSPNSISDVQFEPGDEDAMRINDTLLDGFCEWSSNVLQEAIIVEQPTPFPGSQSCKLHDGGMSARIR